MGEVEGEVRELLKGEVGKVEKEVLGDVRSGLFRDFCCCMAARGLRYGFVHSCIA